MVRGGEGEGQGQGERERERSRTNLGVGGTTTPTAVDPFVEVGELVGNSVGDVRPGGGPRVYGVVTEKVRGEDGSLGEITGAGIRVDMSAVHPGHG